MRRIDDPAVEIDRLLGPASARLEAGRHAEQARPILAALRAALPLCRTEGLPPADVRESEDGSATLAWYLPSRRLAFVFEVAAGESSWHFVAPGHLQVEPLADADVRGALALLLDEAPRG